MQSLGRDRRLLDVPGIAFFSDGRAHLAVTATEGFGLNNPSIGHAIVIVEGDSP